MKKKHIYKALFLLFFTISSNSQNHDFTIKNSPLEKQISNRSELEFLDITKSGIHVIVRKKIQLTTGFEKDKYSIELYDQNLSFLRKEEIKSIPFYNIYTENDSIYLLYDNKTKSKVQNPKGYHGASNYNIESHNIIAYTASINDLKFKTKPFYQLTKKKSFDSYFLNSNYVKNQIIVSDNKKYMAFIFSAETSDKIIKQNNDFILLKSDFSTSKTKTYSQAYKIVVFKDKENILYTQNLIINHGAGWPYIYDLKINEEDGSIYFFEREQIEPNKFMEFKIYRLATTNLIKVNNHDAKKINLGVLTNDKYLGATDISFHKNKLYLTGAYASDIKRKNYKGFFKCKLNSDNLIVEERTFLPFSKKFIEDRIAISENKSPESGLEFNPLIPKKVFFDEDDNCIINISECFGGIYFRNKKAPGSFIRATLISNIPTITHTFAVAAKISKDNKLTWDRSIYIGGAKLIRNSESFSSAYMNNKNYIFFNQKAKVMKKVASYLNETVHDDDFYQAYTATINEKGIITYKDLHPSHSKDSNLFSTSISQGKNNQYLFWDRKINKFRAICKISF